MHASYVHVRLKYFSRFVIPMIKFVKCKHCLSLYFKKFTPLRLV